MSEHIFIFFITCAEYNKLYEGQDHITLPYVADDAVVESAVKTMKG